jgi:hypothetical protein
MPKRSSKDINVTAFSILQQTTGQAQPKAATVSLVLDNAALRKQLMQEMGRRGGKKGGKARAKSLTPAQRRTIAVKAASARWSDKE